MRSVRPSRRAWAIAGAFLTLLAISLIAPTPAVAGCGHPGERPGIGLDLDRLDGPAQATDRVPLPKPCSGPSCSNRSAPLPTSAPAPSPRVELWGLEADRLLPCPVDSAAWVVEQALVRPVYLALAIFHPPRSSR